MPIMRGIIQNVLGNGQEGFGGDGGPGASGGLRNTLYVRL